MPVKDLIQMCKKLKEEHRDANKRTISMTLRSQSRKKITKENDCGRNIVVKRRAQSRKRESKKGKK